MPRRVRAGRHATGVEHEAIRLAKAMAMTLGEAARRTRRDHKLTQATLAARVGIHPSRLSQLERGEGAAAPLLTWVALGVALDRPLAVAFSRATSDTSVRDAGHLELQELALNLATRAGWRVAFELATKPSDPSRSIDVAAADEQRRILVVEEIWNTSGDVGASVRSTRRKLAEAEGLAVARWGEASSGARGVWIVRPSEPNRRLIARYPAVFAAAFPGSSRQWVRALAGDADPPQQLGLVWGDAAAGRLMEWRRH